MITDKSDKKKAFEKITNEWTQSLQRYLNQYGDIADSNEIINKGYDKVKEDLWVERQKTLLRIYAKFGKDASQASLMDVFYEYAKIRIDLKKRTFNMLIEFKLKNPEALEHVCIFRYPIDRHGRKIEKGDKNAELNRFIATHIRLVNLCSKDAHKWGNADHRLRVMDLCKETEELIDIYRSYLELQPGIAIRQD